MIVFACVGLGLAVTFALFAIAHHSDNKNREALEKVQAEQKSLDNGNGSDAH